MKLEEILKYGRYEGQCLRPDGEGIIKMYFVGGFVYDIWYDWNFKKVDKIKKWNA